MAREIKFRALDASTKPSWVYLDYAGDTWEEHTNGWGLISEDTIGQYTGLKDKNGVEIYEGDILRVHTGNHETGGIGQVLWFESGCNFAVIGILNQSHHHAFPEMAKEGMYHQLVSIIARHSEVIGNIYENPDLLKGQA